jgi:uncharacterized membrane protein (UPF0127 family)
VRVRPLTFKLMRLACCIALSMAAISGAGPAAAAEPAEHIPANMKQPGDFPRVKLSAGMFVIDAAVASNDADREQGLMYRTHLAPNEGMLFVFQENAGHCFWMKNTILPLSVAFINGNGIVTDLDEMQAETTNNHCPTHAGYYVLEMSKGWFTAKGIKVGTQIGGLPPPM